MTPRKGLQLETILNTAAAIADTKGLEQVTLASVAAELGVRSPSLYNHVNGLPELKELLATRGLKLLNDRFAAAEKGAPNGERLLAYADAYLAFAEECPGLYELTLKSPAGGTDLQQELASSLVAKMIEAVQTLGIRGEEAIHAVRGFRSLLHGFASIGQKGGFGMPVDVKASIHFVLNSYIRGLVVAVDESSRTD
ncbi:TetR family transcriptional regulator [Paenibacillus agaridevorans]|uniref:TetR family transcriptional regulator n=2 Tax=Paenibacillus agaridevorans TaxID=171404 RepID=A0A2R5ETB7_9BACL|nr:TetR family transcriptional regulator [Paenibacillus agaridevorans]